MNGNTFILLRAFDRLGVKEQDVLIRIAQSLVPDQPDQDRATDKKPTATIHHFHLASKPKRKSG